MASKTEDDVWVFLRARRFAEAIDLGRALMKLGGRDSLNVSTNLAQAYLATGQFREAYDCYHIGDTLRRELGPPGGSYLDLMAKSAWLCGDKSLATRHAVQDVRELQQGQTTMADSAGGVSNGLFLYFCGVTIDPGVKVEAISFLKKLASNKARARLWPGPLGQFVAGVSAVENVFVGATGAHSLSMAKVCAESSLLARRQLIEALFYLSTKLFDGDEIGAAVNLLRECVALENPHIELEWYMAQKWLCELDTRTQ